MSQSKVKEILDSAFSWSSVDEATRKGWHHCLIREKELIRIAVDRNVSVRDIIPSSLEWQGGLSYPGYTDNPDTKEKVFLFIAKLKD